MIQRRYFSALMRMFIPFGFFLCAGFFPEATQAEAQKYIVENVANKKLPGRSGYFVLDLNLERLVSKVAIQRLGKSSTKPYVLGPFSPGHHLRLIPLPAGAYQLVSVAVPHYDLPYRFDYSEYETLKFKIVKAHTNYLGQILVGKTRGKSRLDISVRNRLAYMQDALHSHFANILNQYPLAYAGNATDHFFENFVLGSGGKVQ